MKASILGIGTELTSGQILNRNANWISHKLSELGVETSLHLVVPDERSLILNALEYSSHKSIDFIFITGGLGPTSDDFTRDLVAEFWQRKMIFDEASWQYICDRLNQRGVPVREMQKQQCYFPDGSTILTNVQGTAHGFYFNNINSGINSGQLQHVFVLPGPPREIDCIWKDHIDAILKKQTEHINRQTTLTWDCLGISEPELAHLMEEICAPYKKWIEIGYRVHPPYVECKIIFHESNRKHILQIIEKIETDLMPWIVLRNGEDVVERLIAKLKKFDQVIIHDSASDGVLAQRITPPIFKQNFDVVFCQSEGDVDSLGFDSGSSSESESESESEKNKNSIVLTSKQIRLHFKKTDSNQFECQLHTKTYKNSHLISSPFEKIPTLQERHLQYSIEKALLNWSK